MHAGAGSDAATTPVAVAKVFPVAHPERLSEDQEVLLRVRVRVGHGAPEGSVYVKRAGSNDVTLVAADQLLNINPIEEM